ncbi:MAG: hypothetical protein J5846_07520 [Desulfovibrio sp.]|nr:hypothetical protein [Desulfovibrio sp.]
MFGEIPQSGQRIENKVAKMPKKDAAVDYRLFAIGTCLRAIGTETAVIEDFARLIALMASDKSIIRRADAALIASLQGGDVIASPQWKNNGVFFNLYAGFRQNGDFLKTIMPFFRIVRIVFL